MTFTFEKSRLPRVKATQWSRIAHVLAREPLEQLMAHDLGNQASIPYDMAYAVLLALFDSRLAEAQWLIYHRCAEHPVFATSFEKGIPELPTECPECEEPAQDSEFTFDVQFRLLGAVELR